MGSERIEEVDLFIEKQIETVPHLEVLLLIWRGRPKAWIPSEMASALLRSSGGCIEDIVNSFCSGLATTGDRFDLRLSASVRLETDVPVGPGCRI
jgi:hypothetical protein